MREGGATVALDPGMIAGLRKATRIAVLAGAGISAWYEWRRAAVLTASPNAGHRALAAMEQRVAELTLITQNVDDLHERAGSRGVVHLHGELAKPCCAACRRGWVHSPGIAPVPPGGARIEPPRCGCGGLIRPGVVWFGESLPETPWQAACEAAARCEVLLRGPHRWCSRRRLSCTAQPGPGR